MRLSLAPSHALAGLALAALLLAGCTTLHEVAARPAELALEPGARLVVTLKGGEVIEQRFVEANAQALVVERIDRAGRGLDRENRAEDKRRVSTAIGWDRIAKVEERRVSGWRTVALVVIPVAALAGAASQMAVMP
jgi:hypothetical protein